MGTGEQSEGTREQVPATPTGGLHIVNYWKSTNPGRFGRGSFQPGRFGRVVSAWVVLAKFWGESIRPILVGRFDHESFLPWVVSVHVCVCVGGGGYSTYWAWTQHPLFTQLKYQEYQAFPNRYLKFCDPPKIPILYLALLRKKPKK